jgi:hypothetical protein
MRRHVSPNTAFATSSKKSDHVAEKEGGKRPLGTTASVEARFRPASRHVYESSLSRIFSERAWSLGIVRSLSAMGIQEKNFIDWAKANLPAQIFPIVQAWNLEFILPQLHPDIILAGVCRSLPIIRRLKVARPVVLLSSWTIRVSKSKRSTQC